ncbi:hypothetical protein CspeluHIS016_0113090 [Cutaneotrichosporon spelunceum]|uniref:PRA1 family protein n=1 Tax=Cutaneotrichosporon spelunceum TaxID=1672016 RepID=A0AAD3TQB1_9TREE|nr:hypothetical protein CspeluHIS016_0113090 [Cutaneotrichosporon spelunceum]
MNMDTVGYLTSVQDTMQNLRQTRLGQLRHPGEFFDYQRVSRPSDTGAYMKRAGYNIRYFSANYAIIVALCTVYALITSPVLLIGLVFLIGGFIGVSRFVTEPFEFQGRTITPQNLYFGVFVLGILLLLFGSPFSAFFWVVGASGVIIGAHAGLLEPGVESEYEGVETV